MSRAIRDLHKGIVITVDDVDSRVYPTEPQRQKLLDGMVDGRRYVYEDEKVDITADEAATYMNEKLAELGKREEEVEKREAELHTRFKEVVEKEIAYETRVDELNKREAALVEKENKKGKQ